MQFDRLPLFEERSHWCCRLHVSKLRIDWQFSTVSMGLIRSPLLLGVCVCARQCVYLYSVKSNIYCSCILHPLCTACWVVINSGFLIHRNTQVCTCRRTHRWIFALRATHCFSGLQYAENVTECIFQMMLRLVVHFVHPNLWCNPLVWHWAPIYSPIYFSIP